MDKAFRLHLDNPEHNPLNRHGKLKLMADMSLEDINATKDWVCSIVKSNADLQIDAAILYLIGVQQGIHNERQRRAALAMDGEAVTV